jgi:hypothetical protein
MELKIDMKLFESGNTPWGNMLASLYAYYISAPSIDVEPRKRIEISFSQALVAVQQKDSEGPKYGRPGSTENPYEILARMAKAVGIREIFKELIENIANAYNVKLKFIFLNPSAHDEQGIRWLMGDTTFECITRHD